MMTSRKARWREHSPAILCVLLGAGIALTLRIFGVTFDSQITTQLFQKLGTSFAPSQEIVLVSVDDASLQLLDPKVGRWPWPRSYITQIVEACGSAGSIGIDILFLEGDRLHPEDDVLFGKAIGRQGHVALAGAFVDDMVTVGSVESALLKRSLMRLPAKGRSQRQAELKQLLSPIPAIADEANRMGHSNFSPSRDHLLRSYNYFISTAEGELPSLAVATASAAQGSSRILEHREEAGLSQELLFYSRPFRRISAVQLIAGGPLPAHWCDGKMVLIGVEAKGLHDLRATPNAGAVSGLEVHATALSNLLQRTWIRSLPPWVALLFALACSALPILWWEAPLQKVLLRWTWMIAAFFAGAGLAFHFSAFRVPWTEPFFAFLGSAGCRLILAIQRERALRTRLQELQEMRTMLGNMLVHDLRSPLGSITMILGMLVSGKSDPARTQRRTELALGEATRMTVLVQSLLDIHRMEVGRMVLHRKKFIWDHVVEEVEKSLSPRADAEKLQIERRNNLPTTEIYADREILKRVLVNLVDNALGFATPGTVVVCDSFIEGGFLTVKVINAGPLLDPADQKEIFEIYSQGSTEGRRFAGGAGLGLAFCKLAIVGHGGIIHCISPAPGLQDGVCVEWRLPLSLAPIDVAESS